MRNVCGPVCVSESLDYKDSGMKVLEVDSSKLIVKRMDANRLPTKVLHWSIKGNRNRGRQP